MGLRCSFSTNRTGAAEFGANSLVLVVIIIFVTLVTVASRFVDAASRFLRIAPDHGVLASGCGL